MADRFAIVLAWVDSQKGELVPFTDDDFWTSASADEIRTMPIYQDSLEEIRKMIR